jgi:ribosomal protein S21
MRTIHCEVKLDKKRCTDKDYFDSKLKQFSREVKRSGVLEDLRKKVCYLKPSQMKKLNQQTKYLKWRFY